MILHYCIKDMPVSEEQLIAPKLERNVHSAQVTQDGGQ
jgi:hypothetical protein